LPEAAVGGASEPAAGRPLRLFIAVAAPEPVRGVAEAVVGRLRGSGDVRWVKPENLHLTLKFLGSTPAEKLPQLRQILAETANNYSQFVLQSKGVGAFPNVRKPQTLWLGVEAGGDRLAALADGVDQATHTLGFPRETRPFRGHLTLGRVKSTRGLADLCRRLREEQAGEPASWPVDGFTLVRSDLRPEGPVYTVVQEFPFRREEPAPPDL